MKPRPSVQRLALTKARNTLGAVVKRVHLNKDYVILEKDGVPLAGVMDIDEFEDYLELRDPKVRAIIRKGTEAYRAGRSLSGREVLADLLGRKKGKAPRRRSA